MSSIVPVSKTYSGFDPRTIPGCQLWLDAADTSSLTLSGSSVTQWADKSGNGYNATTSTAPTLSTYNGYPVISFNGTSHRMASNSTVSMTTHTLIAVHRPATINANAQGNTSLFRYQVTNTLTSYIIFPYLYGTTAKGYITTAGGTGAGSLDYQYSSLVENSITTSFNLIMAVISSGSQLIYNNGTQQSSNTKTLTSGTSSSLSLGANSNGSEYYQGDLAEMIVFSSALTSSQRQQIEGYLAWKWGLKSNLPATHPFKLTPVVSRPFQPIDIAGCQLWLDGTDPNGNGSVPANGASLSTWVDKSGSGNTLTAAGSPLPTYISSSRTISYDGSSYFQKASLSFTAYTLFIIANKTSGNGPLYTNTTTTPYSGFFQNLSGNYYLIRNNTTGNDWATAVSPFINGTSYLYSIQYASDNNVNVWSNGGVPAAITTTQTGTITQDSFLLGKRNSASFTENWIGTFSEVIQYNTTLTTAQRQQIEGYLANKWGLRGNLPSTHAYKIVPAITLPFNPLNVSGCIVWLDASDSSTITLSGSNVTQWSDKSGNGKHATAPSNYPTYSTNSLNNYNTIRFNAASGTAKYLDIPAFNFGTSNRSAFFIIQNTGPSSGSGAAPHWFWPKSGNGTNALSIVGWISTTVQGSAGGISSSPNKNQYYLVSYRFGTSAGFEELYLNGTSAGTITKSNGGTSYANADSGYRLGWLTADTSVTYALDGNMAEVILFNTTLTDYQMKQVEGYLAAKWGLQGNLPSTHPYKKIPS